VQKTNSKPNESNKNVSGVKKTEKQHASNATWRNTLFTRKSLITATFRVCLNVAETFPPSCLHSD